MRIFSFLPWREKEACEVESETALEEGLKRTALHVLPIRMAYVKGYQSE